MPDLCWSKTPPAVPGWYWRRWNNSVFVTEVYEVGGELYESAYDGTSEPPPLSYGEWAGPLTPPKEPGDV